LEELATDGTDDDFARMAKELILELSREES